MIQSIIKPWTAAIRLGRALLTPTAPGLIDPASCPARHNGKARSKWGVDLSCHFERLGPPACEPASPLLGRFLFNLPEMYRESLTRDGQSLPPPYRHLGSFWWVSQLTHRLLRPRRSLRLAMRTAARASGLSAALGARTPVIGIHVRHGDSCVHSETHRTTRTCEPLGVYMERVLPYAKAVGATTIFLATDSEVVLQDGPLYYPGFTFLTTPNVTRTGLRTKPPTEILDELIKRRARTGKGIAATQRDALLGAIDAMLLARCDVLVGKFSSGLFRAAYALAAARRGGALPPFVSLDAPWCADYGVPAGLNDNFPKRGIEHHYDDPGREQIDPDGGGGMMRKGGINSFLC